MKMNQLPVKAYSSDLFTFGVSRKFISEASTINMENFEPLYNDSNDCGLAIK